MASEEDEWNKLPTTGKIQHKSWNARVAGYKEASKLFLTQTERNASIFNEYLGLIKKIASETNAVAQEAAYDLILSFLQEAGCAKRCAPEITSILITKGLNANKAKAKEKASECLLQLVEVEAHELVVEEVNKELSNKNPKVVVACLQTAREALSLFGPKVFSVKAILKTLPKLLEDRDKNVRLESKLLIVEIYRWVSEVVKRCLPDLKPIVVSELNELFEKLPNEKAIPSRHLASQRPAKPPPGSSAGDGFQGPEAEGEEEEEESIDPDELITPVEVFSKIPADYWTNIAEKKWQTRQSALESLDKLFDTPKIAPANFADVVKSLVHVISKDSAVMLVALAASVLGKLASGLRKSFAPYSHQSLVVAFEKFKEKKVNVVAALRVVADEASKHVLYDSYSEELITALGHKAPGIKLECASFVSRLLLRPGASKEISKKSLKTLINALTHVSTDTVMDVREAGFLALGTCMYVMTPKLVDPLLTELDPIRLAKVKECYENLTKSGKAPPATVNKSSPAKPPPSKGKAKPGEESGEKPPGKAAGPKKVTKPVKGQGHKAVESAGGSGKKAATADSAIQLPTETLMSDDEVLAKASDLFDEATVKQISSTAWKERVEAINTLKERFNKMSSEKFPVQVLCRLMLLKPGIKDTNIVSLQARLAFFQAVLDACLANSVIISSTLTESLIPDLGDKTSDVKVGKTCQHCLTTLAELSKFDLVASTLLELTFTFKNPKSQAELLNWLAGSLMDFGYSLPTKEVVKKLQIGLNATNPAVRQASLNLAGAVHLFIGDKLRKALSDEKPAVQTLLTAEFDKNAGKKAPKPTKGRAAATAGGGDGSSEDQPEGAGGEQNQEQEEEEEEDVDRVDISGRITDDMLTAMKDKSWKERQRGLSEVQAELTKAKHVTGGQGKLQTPLSSLASLCSDSNKNLGKQALQLLGQFATALARADAVDYVKYVEPAILQSMADSKQQFREVAVSALSAWQSRVPFYNLADNDVLSDALKTENPFLRSELLTWLASALEKLPANYGKKLPPDFAANLLPHVYSAMEDRSPDARKAANLALPQLMRVLGWPALSNACKKLKPASRDALLPQLEKVKASMHVEPPAATSKPKTVRGGGAKPKADSPEPPDGDAADDDQESVKPSPEKKGGKKKPVGRKTGPQKKSSEETVEDKPPPVDDAYTKAGDSAPPILPIPANKQAKQARLADEKKRKLLKWDFDVPKKDHVEQLKTLFTAAGASPEFHALLFQNDFKYHVKAVDQFTALLELPHPSGWQSTLVNLDLIVRWIALRFFDTNPVVTVRCIVYLNKLFTAMIEAGKTLSETDANALVPYLVIKVGDSKDAVRASVRDLFKLIARLVAPSKLFSHLAGGFKSKTNKTRQECIDETSCLIETFGLNVCQPSIPAAVKVLGHLIGDRDSGVRNATLNALTVVYGAIGDKLFKILNDLSDKDRTMLEERIKRSGRQPGSVPMEARPTVLAPASIPVPNQTMTSSSIINNRPEQSARAHPVNAVTPGDHNPFPPDHPSAALYNQARAMLGEFGERGTDKAPDAPVLQSYDAEIDELLQPVDIPELKVQTTTSLVNALLRISPDAASAITVVTTAISSSDLMTSCNAVAELDYVLRDEKYCLLVNHINHILMLISSQLHLVTSRYLDDESITSKEIELLLRCHLAAIDSAFMHTDLAQEVTRDTLRELLQVLFLVMLDERVAELGAGENFIRAINTLTASIISNSNPTDVLSALIRLLHESIGDGRHSDRFTQIVMKGMWQITKAFEGQVNLYALDVILLDYHHFLKAFPTPWWKSRKSDIPLRTIKTMLYTLCSIMGDDILGYLSNIPNKEDSELESYLLRSLKILAEKNGNSAKPKPNPVVKPTSNNPTSLHQPQIDQTELGPSQESLDPKAFMADLDNLRRMYGLAPVDPNLSATELLNQDTGGGDQPVDNSFNHLPPGSGDAGQPTNDSSGSGNAIGEVQDQQDPSSAESAPAPRPTLSSAEIMEFRRRLAQIKSGKPSMAS